MSSFNNVANGRAGAMAFALEALASAVFGSAGRAIAAENNRRALNEELSMLSERELVDIGLSPADVQRSFWDGRNSADLMLRRP